jgi:hypothetical protein
MRPDLIAPFPNRGNHRLTADRTHLFGPFRDAIAIREARQRTSQARRCAFGMSIRFVQAALLEPLTTVGSAGDTAAQWRLASLIVNQSFGRVGDWARIHR